MIECDELWSFVFSKNNKVYVWLAIDRKTREIVGCYIGNRSRQSAIIAAVLLLNTEGLNRGLIRFVSHLSPSQGEDFIKLATITIRSVTRGIIGVAIIQTLMVGLGLVLAKIPAAGLLVCSLPRQF